MFSLAHSDTPLCYSPLLSDAFIPHTSSNLPDPQPKIPLQSFIFQDSPLDSQKNLSKRKVASSEFGEELNRSLKRIKTPAFISDSTSSSLTSSSSTSSLEKRQTPLKKLPKMKWTAEKVDRLRDAVEQVGENWKEVSELIEGTCSRQCRDKWKKIKKNVVKGSWKKKEDEQLRKAVEEYGALWLKVAARVPTRNFIQCRDRWKVIKNKRIEAVDDQFLISGTPPACSIPTGSLFPELNELPSFTFLQQQESSRLKAKGKGKVLKKGSWIREEDERLKKAVKDSGMQGEKDASWKKVASLVSTRDAVQYTRRWRVIGPEDNKTGRWSTDEDDLLRKGIEKHGTRWRKICKSIPGRSADKCRHRWKTIS